MYEVQCRVILYKQMHTALHNFETSHAMTPLIIEQESLIGHTCKNLSRIFLTWRQCAVFPFTFQAPESGSPAHIGMHEAYLMMSKMRVPNKTHQRRRGTLNNPYSCCIWYTIISESSFVVLTTDDQNESLRNNQRTTLLVTVIF